MSNSFTTPWTHEPTRLLCPWDFPGKDTGVGCHFLLKGIFPTQGPNMCHLHWLPYFFTTKPPGKPCETLHRLKKKKKFFFKLLAFTCYSVVLLSVVEQSEYLYIYHLFVTIEHWVEFPVLYSRTFSLVIYFIPSSVFMSIPISKFIPLSLPPLVSVHLFSTSVSISALQIGSSVPFF